MKKSELKKLIKEYIRDYLNEQSLFEFKFTYQEAVKIFKQYGVSNPNKLSPSELKSEYKKLAVKYHPDKPGGNTQDFQKIGAAYEVLKLGPPSSSQSNTNRSSTNQSSQSNTNRSSTNQSSQSNSQSHHDSQSSYGQGFSWNQPPQTKKCEKCQKTNDIDNVYCLNCGHKLGTKPEETRDEWEQRMKDEEEAEFRHNYERSRKERNMQDFINKMRQKFDAARSYNNDMNDKAKADYEKEKLEREKQKRKEEEEYLRKQQEREEERKRKLNIFKQSLKI